MTNEPANILSAWTALEVLSPVPFREPRDLAAGGDPRLIASVGTNCRLPWEGSGEKARPYTQLFYQIVLGSIDLEKATTKLLNKYSDSRPERPVSRGQAVLAAITVDRYGKPVESPAVSLSSFAWGVPRALFDDLKVLAEWPQAESKIISRVDGSIRKYDENSGLLPIDKATIEAALLSLVKTLQLEIDLLASPIFIIKVYHPFRNPEPPELLLNSFFLRDLAFAKELLRTAKAPANLRRYLGMEKTQERHNLLNNSAVLESAIAPSRLPPSSWPSPGRHPLVLLQQAAVNLSLEISTTGIVAVNGPPGTGKTTLLRDLVAAMITQRAEKMMMFDDPESAFTHKGKLRANNSWLHQYVVDDTLKGFEMVVASSNNKAVENISAELPALTAIGADANLRYFKTLSDALLKRETWGVIAAVLGNATNRYQFKNAFWWDKDVGLSTYLAEAAGTPQFIEEAQESGAPKKRRPKVIVEENPPAGHDEAMKRWELARHSFRKAVRKSYSEIIILVEARDLLLRLPSLEKDHENARNTLASAVQIKQEACELVLSAKTEMVLRKAGLEQAKLLLDSNSLLKPSWISRLPFTANARAWRKEHKRLEGAHMKAVQAHQEACLGLSSAEGLHHRANEEVLRADSALKCETERLQETIQKIEKVRLRLGPNFAGPEFFSRDREQLQKSSPWCDAALQITREQLFIEAIKVHKAFVDASAKPLRNNLSTLMQTFSGSGLSGEKANLLGDLWASLFLVVPLVSTTFASVERMLGALPPETFGWLFIDEAGQALPQAAVGAIIRTRRSVVVGDPIQIEPVVTLPDSLTQQVCRNFQVDPDQFNAPTASVQTLADQISPYFAQFETRFGSREVGMPLLVHRRCTEPMFGISNAIAYENLMVNAKVSGSSKIRDVLGASKWINVVGSGTDKWCDDEGKMVLQLLTRLQKASVQPDLYIITPFVIVADHLKNLLLRSNLLNAWTDNPFEWVNARIGTVHTVQGREAEAVILVLGAPNPNQAGARGWAGRRPNLLNVAVTRAKEVLYVIGNRELWRGAGVFIDLHSRMTE